MSRFPVVLTRRPAPMPAFAWFTATPTPMAAATLTFLRFPCWFRSAVLAGGGLVLATSGVSFLFHGRRFGRRGHLVRVQGLGAVVAALWRSRAGTSSVVDGRAGFRRFLAVGILSGRLGALWSCGRAGLQQGLRRGRQVDAAGTGDIPVRCSPWPCPPRWSPPGTHPPPHHSGPGPWPGRDRIGQVRRSGKLAGEAQRRGRFADAPLPY